VIFHKANSTRAGFNPVRARGGTFGFKETLEGALWKIGHLKIKISSRARTNERERPNVKHLSLSLARARKCSIAEYFKPTVEYKNLLEIG
jgi:hypothetical protein